MTGPAPWVGLARRAIDDMTELARHTARFPGGPTVSERAVFHKELGRADTRVRAARAVHREAMGRAWDIAQAGDIPGEDVQLAVTTDRRPLPAGVGQGTPLLRRAVPAAPETCREGMPGSQSA